VIGPSRDADADVITAGREPRLHPARPGLVRLLVIAQTAALNAVIAVALPCRAQTGRPAMAACRPPGRARQHCPRCAASCSGCLPGLADQYWLALAPSPVYASPGLRGRFAQGAV